MESFCEIFRYLRLHIDEPKRWKYVLHTPQGSITIQRVTSREDHHYSLVEGEDENNESRHLYCSDELLRTFPLELVNADKELRQVGFTVVEDEALVIEAPKEMPSLPND